ncbi:SusC/RagA family TonB-linked outer membrane protein [Flammeovirga yaeyamensis]|uniref:SusC/RagA family TonB-linked outer membrane protein n=1 Tax=Flammeovirga yaeyamensis TaxID=367791 RepID=A0AAX1N8E4_9BACT|nr:SusC/RagA family TonB-linked outer membrane protein [Flammeovirga yaeyamensis]MBB3698775.1 TonB-linked SusC/RagA family outer membrane protein [Flammeovirga yaeyamensis]NMF37360.1 SusC/RagA family TonB-linked outer membrane protein [Flammeovirga yaeyamensis]QWG03824.1 SusC/RagA family TonB-linked outer membrane protein [Flammeovirga yaeyamensis]
MKRILLFFSLTLCAITSLYAQDKKVSGVVSDASGESLPGATVMVVGTTVGAVTDFDGNFAIDLPEEAAELEVRLIGYATQRVAIGTQSVINFTMEEDAQELEEVVVTALGMEKDKKSLGYSVTEVKGDNLKSADNDILGALNGQVAGVQVTQSSGAVGSSSRVVIRGNSSLTGDNQPLYVIDGVPVDNTYNSGNTSSGGADFGSPISDLNPDDIESMTVLKGPNAAALYGSRAVNGAIIVTTKKGKGADGLGITLSNTTTFQTPLLLPNYQNEYGQGMNGEFAFVDGRGGGTHDGFDESWGPRLDAGYRTTQYNSNGELVEMTSNPNNVRDFFETGHVSTTNLAIAHGTENTNMRFSLMYSDQKGMVPNTGLNNISTSMAIGHKINEKLRFDAKATYSNRASDNLPSQGYGANNVMQQFVWFGRQVDTNDLKNYKKADGTPYNWNYNYHDNPYWIVNENTNSQRRDRLNGYASMKYNFTDYLSLQVKGGTDFYSENRMARTAKYSINNPTGGFVEENYFVSESNFDFLLSFSKDFGTDWNISANAGGNNMYRNYKRDAMTVTGLATAGIYTPANAVGQVGAETWFEEQVINSLYATAAVGFRDYLFLDLSIRNDWSSTLPAANDSFLYPSINLSYVFSEHFELPNFISNGKVRGGWAQVGAAANPYMLRNTYGSPLPWDGNPMFKYGDIQSNPNLRPETTNSWETGLEMSFLNNRIGFEAVYYQKNTYDQIVNADVSAASGYRYTTINAGEIENKGVEFMIYGTPVQTADFQWDVSLNLTKNVNTVKSLADGVDSFVLGEYWGLTTEARPGEAMGTLYGIKYQRSPEGDIIVNEQGIPMREEEKTALGDINPDWRGGIRNTVTYKNFVFSALIDMSFGGSIFSVTNMFGEYAGVLDVTAVNREAGRTVGVVSDGKGGYVPNEVAVDAMTYYQSLYGIHEEYVYDASYIRLAQLSIGYRLPKEWLGNSGIKGATFSLVGNDLWMMYKNAPNIDPQAGFGAGMSGQGFEFGQLPTARSFGFDIKLQF